MLTSLLLERGGKRAVLLLLILVVAKLDNRNYILLTKLKVRYTSECNFVAKPRFID